MQKNKNKNVSVAMYSICDGVCWNALYHQRGYFSGDVLFLERQWVDVGWNILKQTQLLGFLVGDQATH